jgi:hypothetical protein
MVLGIEGILVNNIGGGIYCAGIAIYIGDDRLCRDDASGRDFVCPHSITI